MPSTVMASRLGQCSLCRKHEACNTSFREVALAMKYEHILTEYSGLSDAWRVYQGVALYREYRGLGGETCQLDEDPCPCHLCLVKIVNMAQALHVLTTTIEAGQPPPTPPQPLQGLTVTNCDSSVSPPTQTVTVEDLPTVSARLPHSPPATRPRRTVGRSLGDRKPDFQVETGPLSAGARTDHDSSSHVTPAVVPPGCRVLNISTCSSDATSVCSPLSSPPPVPSPQVATPTPPSPRPRRTAVRSFLERNPDFDLDLMTPVLGVVKSKSRPNAKSSAGDSKMSPLTAAKKHPELRIKDDINIDLASVSGETEIHGDCHGDTEEWRSDRFRKEHLESLDCALKSWDGWNSAVRSSKNMEKEVYKNAASEAEYIAGINRLMACFKKGSGVPIKTSIKQNYSAPKTEESCVGKGTRTQFQYVVKTSRSGKQGRKYIQVDSSNTDSLPPVPGPDLCAPPAPSPAMLRKPIKKTASSSSVISPSESLTTGTAARRMETASPGRKPQSSQQRTLRTSRGRDRTSGRKSGTADFGERQESGTGNGTETATRIGTGTLDAYYLNNTGELESPLDNGSNGRPQRRKRSIEERHPDFVMDVPRERKSGGRANKRPRSQVNLSIQKTAGCEEASNWFMINSEEDS